MSQPIISVENLGKAYRIGLKEKVPDTLTQAALGMARAPWKNFHRLRRMNTFSSQSNSEKSEEDTIWALRDVSFEVNEGEVVGIIGRNGAGKSTLLKILSRITEPTTGRAVIRGRVSSLLEVGTGFHPELTGRENIYMNGTILGMTKREIDRKFDEIVDFSGVEKFLDTPVKRYSSGMQVRLAFAVAAHLEPEILVVDEVLAVGDIEFQSKCLGKMRDVATTGRTVLFVSHNMAAVDSLCTKALMLLGGTKYLEGNCDDILREYVARGQKQESIVNLSNHEGRTTSYAAFATEMRVYDERDVLSTSLSLGCNATFEVDIIPPRPCTDLLVKLQILNERGLTVATCFSRQQHQGKVSTSVPTRSRCSIRNLRLAPGLYDVSLQINDQRDIVDVIDRVTTIEIVPKDVYHTGRLPRAEAGIYIPEVEWEFQLKHCGDSLY